jgi:hypothetical protein
MTIATRTLTLALDATVESLLWPPSRLWSFISKAVIVRIHNGFIPNSLLNVLMNGTMDEHRRSESI